MANRFCDDRGMFMNVCMLALMAMIPSHSVPITGEPCASSGYTRAWNELLHPASISINDTRYGLHQGGPLNGLTPAETEWVSKVTGRVICPGAPNLKGRLGSGALVGRNDSIVTNVHVVRNDDGSPRDDWPNCYFESQSQPPVRRGLKFIDPRTIFGIRVADENRYLDYAIVRLDSPILGVEPVPIAETKDLARIKNGFLVVSAHQDRMRKNRKVLLNEPIIQNCQPVELLAASQVSGAALLSNCSGTGGASGSLMLTRDESGRLVGVGTVSQTGTANFDKKPYDPNGNSTISLLYDGPFYKDLQRSLN